MEMGEKFGKRGKMEGGKKIRGKKRKRQVMKKANQNKNCLRLLLYFFCLRIKILFMNVIF